MKSYQTNDSGIYLFEQESDNLPFGAVKMPPPLCSPGFVAVYDRHETMNRSAIEFGEDGHDLWEVVLDNRNKQLYKTHDGSEYALGNDSDGKRYIGLDTIPDWLTDQPPPSKLHVWVNEQWILDAEAAATEAAITARAQRDFALVELDKVVSNPLRWAEFDDAQKGEIASYRQALLDVPQQTMFPTNIAWPEAPDFL